jgi:hypothetical protein
LNLNQNNETYNEFFLRNGYIDSFVDFFYISSRKIPDLKSKYERDYNIKLDSQSSRGLSDPVEHAHLRDIKDHLLQAEKALRKNHVVEAIKSYNALMDFILHKSDILVAIYIVQKYINLSKKYELHKLLIEALIDMGNRFENEEFPKEDSIISMNLKEEAKRLYNTHFSGEENRDFKMEEKIYDSLNVFYRELAQKVQDQNNFPKSVEYLNKQLENLKQLGSLAKLKQDDQKENEYLTAQINSYLKIAEMNFKMKYYDSTLEDLEIMQELLTHAENNVF